MYSPTSSSPSPSPHAFRCSGSCSAGGTVAFPICGPQPTVRFNVPFSPASAAALLSRGFFSSSTRPSCPKAYQTCCSYIRMSVPAPLLRRGQHSEWSPECEPTAGDSNLLAQANTGEKRSEGQQPELQS